MVAPSVLFPWGARDPGRLRRRAGEASPVAAARPDRQRAFPDPERDAA